MPKPLLVWQSSVAVSVLYIFSVDDFFHCFISFFLFIGISLCLFSHDYGLVELLDGFLHLYDVSSDVFEPCYFEFCSVMVVPTDCVVVDVFCNRCDCYKQVV